ncbi:MAG: ABC transporter permease subunit [bacterium]|nr:ABC transporter permease subunit [bacterium]
MSTARLARERATLFLMQLALVCVIAATLFIMGTVLFRGVPALTWAMLTSLPTGGFYLGKGGGILNAIVGSVLLSIPATLLATLVSLPVATALQTEYLPRSLARIVTVALDILWGIPSIVYGVFGFLVMLAFGIGTSLLGGILTLTFLMIPVMTRAMSEVIAATPLELKETAYAIGATKYETMRHVILRQSFPGLVTAMMLAFGRGIGDAAAVLFTAGYSDRIPRSLTDPAASLPLAVFFQLASPSPIVQQRAYAAACVLMVIVLTISIGARLLGSRARRFTIR